MCCVVPEPERDELEDYEARKAHQFKKIMLLGAGSGGKSTIFKQLHCIYDKGIEKTALQQSIAVIRTNCVAAIVKLLRLSVEFYEEDNIKYSCCRIDFDDIELCAMINEILKYSDDTFERRHSANSLQNLSNAIETVWKQQQIQYVFAQRHQFPFITNMKYFLDTVQDLFSDQYEGSTFDILRYRLRTTGICHKEFEINGKTYDIFDVGGQRNERRKWINVFANVHAILYVVALSEYASVLFEEESINAMHESLQLFEELAAAKWFKKADIILIFTKADLFRDKLRNVPLSSLFHGKYDGPKYVDDESYEQHVAKSLQYIQALFEKRYANTNKTLHSFVINATDTNSVNAAFRDIFNIICNQQ